MIQPIKILRSRPTLFFRLSGVRISDFDALVAKLHPIWLKSEKDRLSRPDRKRAIGAGVKYSLDFESKLLMCLIYYRTYISHVFLGLLFGVSSPTVSVVK